MKNKLIILLACLLFGSVQLQAIDFDASVGFNGEKATLRTPLMDGMELIFGLEAGVPIQPKAGEVTGGLNLGVATDLPLLGYTDILVKGSKTGQGVDNPFTANVVNISKSYTHNLNDQVSIGIKLVLADITITDKAKSAHIIPSVYPVIGTTISLF